MARILDPRFERLLDDAGLSVLHDNPHAAYGVWSDLTLAWTNSGWQSFARDNRGERLMDRYLLGADVSAVFGPFTRFYQRAFEQVLATNKPWEHVYECSSPDVYRQFRMTVVGLAGWGLAVISALEVSRPHDLVEAGTSAWVHPDGLIRACGHCRRAQSPADGRWAFVAELLSAPPAPVSHGLCPPCYAMHYTG